MFSCTEKKEIKIEKGKRKTVTVAAVQCSSKMGQKEYNFQKISKLIKNAVDKSAKIVVLPEAAVSGYMNPANLVHPFQKCDFEKTCKIQMC